MMSSFWRPASSMVRSSGSAPFFDMSRISSGEGRFRMSANLRLRTPISSDERHSKNTVVFSRLTRKTRLDDMAGTRLFNRNGRRQCNESSENANGGREKCDGQKNKKMARKESTPESAPDSG